MVPQWQTQAPNTHPGKITNAEFLHTDPNEYLHGQGGKETGTEKEFIDRYMKK